MEQNRPREEAGAWAAECWFFIQGRSGKTPLEKMALEQRPEGGEGAELCRSRDGGRELICGRKGGGPGVGCPWPVQGRAGRLVHLEGRGAERWLDAQSHRPSQPWEGLGFHCLGRPWEVLR